jgi:hypothetical protein
VRIIRRVESLPTIRTADMIDKHLGRQEPPSAGMTGWRARASADFIVPRGIVAEEAAESRAWMALLIARGLVPEARVQAR